MRMTAGGILLSLLATLFCARAEAQTWEAARIEKAMRAAMPPEAACRRGEAGLIARCVFDSRVQHGLDYTISWSRGSMMVRFSREVAELYLKKLDEFQQALGFEAGQGRQCVEEIIELVASGHRMVPVEVKTPQFVMKCSLDRPDGASVAAVVVETVPNNTF
jgi:hypothetical protein